MKQKVYRCRLKCIQAQGVVFEAGMHIEVYLEGCTMIDGLASIVFNESIRDLHYLFQPGYFLVCTQVANISNLFPHKYPQKFRNNAEILDGLWLLFNF